MSAIQLRHGTAFLRCPSLFLFDQKRYHHRNCLKDYRPTHHLLRGMSPNFFTPLRHFSYTGFYTILSQSTPVQSLQNLLIDIHQWSNLPWWSVIALTTLTVRTLVVFPLAIHQTQVITRLANINSEIAKLVPQLNQEVNVAKRMYKWDEIQAKKVFKKQLRVIHNRSVLRDNCHPFKTVLLALFQIPLWICLSVSLRNLTFMAYGIEEIPSPVGQLKTEGFLWFPDLTVPDPIAIPLLLMTINLALTEVHALRQVGKRGLLQKMLLNGSRIVIVVVSVVATINPSSVSFYWLCSSTFGLIQSILLMFPKVRRLLRIPKTANESSTPFLDIATNFKKRFSGKYFT